MDMDNELFFQYLRESKEFGLRPGDRVKCVRTAKRRERGWPNTWTPEMNAAVGKEFTVQDVDGTGQVYLDWGANSWLGWPFFVFERVIECTKPRDLAESEGKEK